MRHLIVPAGLGLIASAASQSAFAQTESRQAGTNGHEIIVQGRRNDQYRIPPQLRRVDAQRSDRWREQVNRDLGCHAVGPRGCGPGLLRIVSVGAGGNVSVGTPGK